jgi:hypothetical protein
LTVTCAVKRDSEAPSSADPLHKPITFGSRRLHAPGRSSE